MATKKQLLEEAAKLGLEGLDDSMRYREIEAAIEARRAELEAAETERPGGALGREGGGTERGVEGGPSRPAGAATGPGGAAGAAGTVPPEPAVRRYRVQRDARIIRHGHITQLRAGKIVDQTCYDLDWLRGQGVILEPVLD